jgi:hypothetical protein
MPLSRLLNRQVYGGGEAGFPENLFPFQKSTPVYRILHHTLIKHREMMISIS